MRKNITVLETMEISPSGSSQRYVITVTQAVIKTVDSNGYPHYYDRFSGRLKLSPQSSQIIEDRILHGLSRIEDYVTRYGYSPVVIGRFAWNGGLRPYLNADNTINPQWKRPDGASVGITAIKGIRIKKMK